MRCEILRDPVNFQKSEKGEEEIPLNGSFSTEVLTASDQESGVTIDSNVSAEWIQTPHFSLGGHASYFYQSVPNLPIDSTAALRMADDGGSFFAQETWDLELQWRWEIESEILDRDFVVNNSSAANLEKKIARRWGEAGRLYIYSVLRPTLACEDFQKGYEKVVGGDGPQLFEHFLASDSIPSWNEQQIGSLAALFKYRPFGWIQTLALWSGKELNKVLEDINERVQIEKFLRSNDANRKENFKELLSAIQDLKYNRSYRLPPFYESDDKPWEIRRPDTLDRMEGYARALEEHKKAVAKAVGMKEEGLDRLAEDAKIPNPFDLRLNRDPGSAWAAQGIWEDFRELIKDKISEKPKTSLTIQFGDIERYYFYPGFGLKIALDKDFFDRFRASAWFFWGAAVSNWVDLESPIFAEGGEAYSLGATLGVNLLESQSQRDILQRIALEGEAAHSMPGNEMDPESPEYSIFSGSLTAEMRHTEEISSEFLLSYFLQEDPVSDADFKFFNSSLKIYIDRLYLLFDYAKRENFLRLHSDLGPFGRDISGLPLDSGAITLGRIVHQRRLGIGYQAPNGFFAELKAILQENEDYSEMLNNPNTEPTMSQWFVGFKTGVRF